MCVWPKPNFGRHECQDNIYNVARGFEVLLLNALSSQKFNLYALALFPLSSISSLKFTNLFLSCPVSLPTDWDVSTPSSSGVVQRSPWTGAGTQVSGRHLKRRGFKFGMKPCSPEAESYYIHLSVYEYLATSSLTKPPGGQHKPLFQCMG